MIKKPYLVAAAVAGLMLTTGCSSHQPVADATTGQCHGVNTCKGTSECGGKDSSCHGKNECKSKGWIGMAEADCKTKGGTFKAN